MKKIFSLWAFAFATLSALAVPTRKEAQNAIATLEQGVLSDAAGNAASVITEYARDSAAVVFTLAPETVPWVAETTGSDDVDPSIGPMLLAVYFAGNAKAQLAAGKPVDDPYSGWKWVIRAYREYQAHQRLTIPSIEDFIALEAKGQLKRHADEVVEQIAKEPIAPRSDATHF